MRYVFGVLLFGGFTIFVTPVTIVGMLSTPESPGNALGLVKFAMGAALFFGVPGFFAFPYERRLQAVAWLALGCLAYGGFLVAVLSLIKANPLLMSDDEARGFFENARFRYGVFAAVSAIQAAIFLLLFRRKRTRHPA